MLHLEPRALEDFGYAEAYEIAPNFIGSLIFTHVALLLLMVFVNIKMNRDKAMGLNCVLTLIQAVLFLVSAYYTNKIENARLDKAITEFESELSVKSIDYLESYEGMWEYDFSNKKVEVFSKVVVRKELRKRRKELELNK
ncbi:hypothetical protein [Vibrio crassostreae]|uniref:hypothetical protein n=1 Tax=Vibrio crassostreae TaxID=246167 RepID=UPI001B30DB18|nr:hypothetical protein [Vibrio crassostreae]